MDYFECSLEQLEELTTAFKNREPGDIFSGTNMTNTIEWMEDLDIHPKERILIYDSW